MIKERRYEFSDDKIGIVTPLYSWSIPPHIEEFLKKAKFQCDYLFGVVTYGVYSAGVTNHLEKIAKEAGHNFSYIKTIKMIDNYLPGFDMAKQIEDETKKEIEKNLAVIKSDIYSSKIEIPKVSFINKFATNFMVKGSIKPSKNDVLKIGARGEGIERYYYVEDTCTQCGICVKVCPADNIELDNDTKIKLKNKCYMCFACAQHCPMNSIHIRGEKSRARYRNKNIKLTEIIDANN